MLRPLGRVAPAIVRRFNDRNPSSVTRQAIDATEWVDEVSGEAISSASVQGFPSGLSFTTPTYANSVVEWKVSGGSSGTDYGIVVAWTGSSGRAEVQVWQSYCIDDLAAEPEPSELTFAEQMALYLGTLPTSPSGLTTGQLWNNGGTFAIVT